MRAASLLRPLALLALLATTTAGDCGSDDAVAVDAGPTCKLPSTIINCTAGDDTPCTAMCANAYCYNFSQVGVLCTQACSTADECPSGWSCNMMGRCRPPG